MYNNKAAFMMMKEDSYEFVQTVHVGHPYYLPNFMDGLTYSLPFVMENLSRLAEDLITICLPKADEPVPEDEQEEVERLRGKILALSRLRHVMGGLGEDRRQSIKQPVDTPVAAGAAPPKGATPGQLAKFEAALQMDFMREYLKPGAKMGEGSTKAPLYRGRSKSLNFLELGKTMGVKVAAASALCVLCFLIFPRPPRARPLYRPSARTRRVRRGPTFCPPRRRASPPRPPRRLRPARPRRRRPAAGAARAGASGPRQSSLASRQRWAREWRQRSPK